MSFSVEKLKSIKRCLDIGGFWIRPSVNGTLSFLVKLDSVNRTRSISGWDVCLDIISTLSGNPQSE